MKTTILSAFAALALIAAAPAVAEKAPRAIQNQIGDYSLVSYYTEEGADFRVVTTAVQLGAQPGTPIRVISLLRDGQQAELSVPQDVGKPALSVVLARVGNTLEVRKPTALTN
jgi:hypothetical protein